MKSGIEMIAEERQRQIEVEGYSAQHDSQHKASEFAYAIIAYAEAAKAGINCRESGITDERYISMAKYDMGRHFPWGEFKTTTDIRDLTKVGALAAALIDRLQGEVAVEIEEKPRIISSFVEKHPTNGIISITINTSEKWVTYQINKVATRGFVNITILSDSSECQESIEVPDFDANDYQIFSAQEKNQITIMCIPFAMIKELNNGLTMTEKEQKSAWSEELGSLCLEAANLLSDYAEGVDVDSQLGRKISRARAFLIDLYHEVFYPSTYNPRSDLMLVKSAEWSEEDEEIIHCLEYTVRHFYEDEDTINRCCGWLKSLRPHWKPSDEQIEALLKLEEMHVLEHEKNQENAHLYMVVKSIREQLLKLREE